MLLSRLFSKSISPKIPPKTSLATERGQGLVEYLVIVAMMGVAAIAIVRAMSQTVEAKFTNITYALRGSTQKAALDSIDQSFYKKKDLSNFMDGAGTAKSSGSGSGSAGGGGSPE